MQLPEPEVMQKSVTEESVTKTVSAAKAYQSETAAYWQAVREAILELNANASVEAAAK